MSLRDVQTIIGRAVMMPAYRDELFNDPDRAMRGYDVTDEEAAALKTLDRGRFEAVADDIKRRMKEAGDESATWLDKATLQGLGLARLTGKRQH